MQQALGMNPPRTEDLGLVRITVIYMNRWHWEHGCGQFALAHGSLRRAGEGHENTSSKGVERREGTQVEACKTGAREGENWGRGRHQSNRQEFGRSRGSDAAEKEKSGPKDTLCISQSVR